MYLYLDENKFVLLVLVHVYNLRVIVAQALLSLVTMQQQSDCIHIAVNVQSYACICVHTILPWTVTMQRYTSLAHLL